ncbi:MAG: LacI family DNA-binding transcriptional regulator [Sebaldella sp.]|nr:LacI family DNA-binding transcriptional regulator [Sebaldella sp.]
MTGIKKVASLAGVSTATVSRVINKNQNVSEDKKIRVQKVLKELNYEVNYHAKSLREMKTGMLLFIVTDISNPFYAEIVKGAEEYAKTKNYNVLVCNGYFDRDIERKYFKFIENKLVDGAFIMDLAIEKEFLREFSTKYPIIQCSEYYDDIGVPFVSIDHEKAAFEAASSLLETGFDKLFFVQTAQNFIFDKLRLEGYKRALENHKISFSEEMVIKTDFSYTGGINAAKTILKTKSKKVGIFTVSDVIAVGIVNYLNYKKINIPDDYSIIGFDDIDLCKAVFPKITTIHQPRNKIGKEACKMLINKIHKTENYNDIDNKFLSHKLIKRGTTL